MKKAAVHANSHAEAIVTPDKDIHGKPVLPAIPKNFRQQADIEAFFRFVFENDLRLEALDIIKNVRAQKAATKAVKGRVKH